jgi:uncharacterized protein YceK
MKIKILLIALIIGLLSGCTVSSNNGWIAANTIVFDSNGCAFFLTTPSEGINEQDYHLNRAKDEDKDSTLCTKYDKMNN